MIISINTHFNKNTNYIFELKEKKFHRYVECLFFNEYLERIDFKLGKEILCDIYG